MPNNNEIEELKKDLTAHLVHKEDELGKIETKIDDLQKDPIKNEAELATLHEQHSSTEEKIADIKADIGALNGSEKDQEKDSGNLKNYVAGAFAAATLLMSLATDIDMDSSKTLSDLEQKQEQHEPLDLGDQYNEAWKDKQEDRQHEAEVGMETDSAIRATPNEVVNENATPGNGKDAFEAMMKSYDKDYKEAINDGKPHDEALESATDNLLDKLSVKDGQEKGADEQETSIDDKEQKAKESITTQFGPEAAEEYELHKSEKHDRQKEIEAEKQQENDHSHGR